VENRAKTICSCGQILKMRRSRGKPPPAPATILVVGDFVRAINALLEHDPEKWEPVFGKDHAQTRS
jgi:hypothetical protein